MKVSCLHKYTYTNLDDSFSLTDANAYALVQGPKKLLHLWFRTVLMLGDT